MCNCVLQAAELMAEWAPIEVADALELLSPDFKNDEVGTDAAATVLMPAPQAVSGQPGIAEAPPGLESARSLTSVPSRCGRTL